MKKLLALLLALCLPCYAVADAKQLSIQVETDHALFPPMLASIFQHMEDAETLAHFIDAIVDGLNLKFRVQEDMASVSLTVQESEIADVLLLHQDGQHFLTSSLLPGYAIASPKASVMSGDMQKASKTTDSLFTSLLTWLDSREPTYIRGVFQGDAYEDGTLCSTTTITADDVTSILSAIGVDAEWTKIQSFLRAFELDTLRPTLNDNDMPSNYEEWQIMLRLVMNDHREAVGLSATLFCDEVQTATVSLGFHKQGFRIVAGMGLARENYWWEFSASNVQKENVTAWSGISREWTADKHNSFSYVSANLAPKASAILHCSITAAGERYLWDADMFLGNTRSPDKRVFTFNGMYQPAGALMNYSFTLGQPDSEVLKISVELSDVEGMTASLKELDVCELSGNSDALLAEKLAEQFVAGLLARLIKILPLDVLLDLNPLFMQP